MSAESSCHCSGVGSTPVGLCAQAWRRIVDRSGIFYNKQKKHDENKILNCVTAANAKTHMLIVFNLNSCAYGNVVQSSLKVQSTSGWIVVFVLFHVESCMLCDRYVIAPSWIWHPQVLRAGKEAREKGTADAEWTRAWNTLNCRVHASLQLVAVGAERELNWQLAEVRWAGNRCIFLVQFFCSDDLLGFLHARQDEWFAVVIAISTDAEIDFLWICVLLEGLSDAENCVGWTLLNGRPPWAGCMIEKRLDNGESEINSAHFGVANTH